MRALCLLPLSAVLLSACLTTQENPNYEHSTVYRGDSAATTQYASANPAQTTAASYDPAPITYQQSASYSQPATYESAPIYAHSAPEVPALPSSFSYDAVPATSTAIAAAPAPTAIAAAPTPTAIAAAPTPTAIAAAPTDTAYAAQVVTGTPGFMAMQSQQQAVAEAELAPPLPEAKTVEYAPLRAAGTPVSYDYSRNIITADAVTTGQQLPDSVRVLQGASQNYIVQPGDTVYSLSRRTCVGVNVIQSMNGLSANYGINIGQSIRLPASVC